MDANELRAAFTRFFVERGHAAVPSASLIPHDPSVLFTIAGMIPFKPYFLGDEKAPWPRATSVQKCFRTPDIEIIGTDTYHCTFFEMLGNFSFGEYFKEGAIPMAWELLTEVFGLDGDRLWVTVHDNDDEAEQIWIDSVGFPKERIQRMGDADNFWAMGDTGPCGPDSEIFLDKGAEYGEDGGPKHGSEERFVELWNLVFMQYNRAADGTLSDLPQKNIDTGAGLERILPLLQGFDSIFDTDLFAPIVGTAASIVGTPTARTTRPTWRCASWPTTPGPCRCWWPTACCRPTKAAATCCAGWCAEPCWRRGAWASRSRSPPCWARPPLRCWARPGRRWWRVRAPS